MAMQHPRVSIGSIPAEANSRGSINESLPASQKDPHTILDSEGNLLEGVKLVSGPRKDEMDGHIPGTYKLPDRPGSPGPRYRTDR